MLYELIGVVRPRRLVEAREIITKAGQKILRAGGVIRGIENWGIFNLPKKVCKNQFVTNQGQFFAMRFDVDGQTQRQVRNAMDMDPRVVKVTVVRLGDGKLESLSRYQGPIWTAVKG